MSRLRHTLLIGWMISALAPGLPTASQAESTAAMDGTARTNGMGARSLPAALPTALCRLLPRRPDLVLATLGQAARLDLETLQARCRPAAPAAPAPPLPETLPPVSDQRSLPGRSGRRDRLEPPDTPPTVVRPRFETPPNGPSTLRLRTRRRLMQSEISLRERRRVEDHNRIYRPDRSALRR